MLRPKKTKQNKKPNVIPKFYAVTLVYATSIKLTDTVIKYQGFQSMLTTIYFSKTFMLVTDNNLLEIPSVATN